MVRGRQSVRGALDGTVINPKAPVIKVERAWAYAKGNLTAGGRWREPHTESQPSAVTVTSARRRRPIPPRFSGVGLPRGITVRRWGWRNAIVDDRPCPERRDLRQGGDAMWALNVRGLTRIRGSLCWDASPWVLPPRESRKQLEIDTGCKATERTCVTGILPEGEKMREDAGSGGTGTGEQSEKNFLYPKQ